MGPSLKAFIGNKCCYGIYGNQRCGNFATYKDRYIGNMFWCEFHKHPEDNFMAEDKNEKSIFDYYDLVDYDLPDFRDGYCASMG